MSAFTACTVPSEQVPPPSADQGAAAARFVACLTEQGQTAKILDQGMVGLLLLPGSADNEGDSGGTLGGSSGGSGVTVVVRDSEGEWQASTRAESYPDENGMRTAWQTCESQVPEFTQPEPTPAGGPVDSAGSESRTAAVLAFAECARDNGYADFPDPDPLGGLMVPPDMTEDGFRMLLETCFDPEGPRGFMIQQATAEALTFDIMQVLNDFFQAHPEFGSGGPSVGTEPQQ
jgi:hypothetical protein